MAGRDSRDEAAAAGALEAAALVFLLVHRAGSGARSSLASRFWRVLQKFFTSLSVLPGK